MCFLFCLDAWFNLGSLHRYNNFETNHPTSTNKSPKMNDTHNLSWYNFSKHLHLLFEELYKKVRKNLCKFQITGNFLQKINADCLDFCGLLCTVYTVLCLNIILLENCGPFCTLQQLCKCAFYQPLTQRSVSPNTDVWIWLQLFA